MLSLERMTVDDLAGASLADVVSLLVARDPVTFQSRLARIDMRELAAMPEDFEHTFGWRPPEELSSWRAIELALGLDEGSDGFWRAGDISLGSNIFVDSLPEMDESPETGDFLPANAEVLLTGLYRLAEDGSGDRTVVSVLPDPLGLFRVHSFQHGRGKLGRPRSLKTFLFTEWLSSDEPEEGGRPGLVGMERFEQLIGMATTVDDRLEAKRREASGESRLESSDLYTRSKWLMRPIWGRQSAALAEELAWAPDLGVWHSEKPLLTRVPLLANYWMVAHYFLGNEAACAEAVSLGLQSRGEPTRWLAQHVQRLLNAPGQTRLGRTGPRELEELRQQVRAAARPAQFEGR